MKISVKCCGFLPVLTCLLLSRLTSAQAAYQFPTSKQGVTDYYYNTVVPLAERYNALDQFSFGTKIYNYGWSNAEPAVVPSSTAPLRCPAGTTMVPANETERLAQGYRRYHCYTSNRTLDNLLQLDQSRGYQSMLVIYSTPYAYRNPGCRALSGTADFCVPRDDRMDDYEDLINMLARRYNGGAYGKISHFIPWNEVGNSYYFNMYPVIDTFHSVTATADVNRWVNKYVDMLKRTRAAVNRSNPNALVHVSLDLNFVTQQPAATVLQQANIGSKTILDAVWAQVGTSLDWSIAIHPYFEPLVDYGPNVINFYGLRYLSAYQATRLAQRGVSDPNKASQYWMVASEQGWADVPLQKVAGNMCKAHSIAMATPNLIATLHNHFQGTSDDDVEFAMIPYAAGELLMTAKNYPTFSAYLSTRPQAWGVRDDHFCCQQYSLGCKTPPVAGNAVTPLVSGYVDGVVVRNGQVTIRGWACNAGDPDPIEVHLYVNGPAGSGKMITRWLAADPSEPAVAAACKTRGTLYRYSIDATGVARAYPGAKVYVHGISSTGGDNKLLKNSGLYSLPNSLLDEP